MLLVASAYWASHELAGDLEFPYAVFSGLDPFPAVEITALVEFGPGLWLPSAILAVTMGLSVFLLGRARHADPG